jgi:hypothetical protein
MYIGIVHGVPTSSGYFIADGRAGSSAIGSEIGNKNDITSGIEKNSGRGRIFIFHLSGFIKKYVTEHV